MQCDTWKPNLIQIPHSNSLLAVYGVWSYFLMSKSNDLHTCNESSSINPHRGTQKRLVLPRLSVRETKYLIVD